MLSHNRAVYRKCRRGNVLVLAAFMMIGLMAFVAFAVDIGYLLTARTQLQRTADAAALAAAWQLVDSSSLSGSSSVETLTSKARTVAAQYAALNRVGQLAPTLQDNPDNDADGDVVVGTIADFSDPNAAMSFSDPTQFNAVRVRVRCTEDQNGAIPLFFAKALGLQDRAMQVQATAGLLVRITGFRPPVDGSNLPILPFALDEQTWLQISSGNGSDQWCWDEDDETLYSGSDGIHEASLFPEGTGSPGNRGTVNIGSNNNSTSKLANQILNGITPDDLEFHGGSLKLDANGQLLLNGDPGISAGMKDELASIVGQTRILPIFNSVSGNGNNAVFTIVGFAGVRVLDVKLTGSKSSKHLTIQPANVITPGGISEPGAQNSYFLYSPPRIVR